MHFNKQLVKSENWSINQSLTTFSFNSKIQHNEMKTPLINQYQSFILTHWPLFYVYTDLQTFGNALESGVLDNIGMNPFQFVIILH